MVRKIRFRPFSTARFSHIKSIYTYYTHYTANSGDDHLTAVASSGSGTVRYRHGVRKTFQADAARSAVLNSAISSTRQTRSAHDGYVDFS